MQATSLTCVDLGGHRGLWTPVPGPVAANPQRLTEREYPNMTKKFTWTRGLVAVMLLAGFTSAHAQLTIGGASSVTYAKETLLTTLTRAASDTDDKTKYYNILRAHTISAEPDVAGGANDTYVLSYTLEGMVFNAQVVAPTNFGIAAGGGPGDKEVVFRATAAIDANTAIDLAAQFAVAEDGGSITMMVRNDDLERILGAGKGSKTLGPAMVKVSPALRVTATPAEPGPQAKADHNFLSFGGTSSNPTLSASLGTLKIDVVGGADDDSPAAGQLEDAQGADDSAADIVNLAAITVVPGAGEDTIENPVTFSVEGGFGFVKTLGIIRNS